jgi:Fur family ferric uptake transcriptional regulator
MTATQAAEHRGTHLVDALDRAGYRLTEPRRAVAELVTAQEAHFTAAGLVAEARDRHLGIGRATIFRSLDVFATLGLVERVDLPGGEHAYVVCDPVHHHHAICTSCGRSTDVSDLGLSEALADVGRRSGFRVTAHRLEIFGLCAACDVAGPQSG